MRSSTSARGFHRGYSSPPRPTVATLTRRLRAGAVRADDPPASPVLRLSPRLNTARRGAIAARSCSAGWASLSPRRPRAYPGCRPLRRAVSLGLPSRSCHGYLPSPRIAVARSWEPRISGLSLPDALSSSSFRLRPTIPRSSTGSRTRCPRAVRVCWRLCPRRRRRLSVYPLLRGGCQDLGRGIARQGRAARRARAIRRPRPRGGPASCFRDRTLVRAERLAGRSPRVITETESNADLDRPVRPAEIALAVFLVASVVAFAFVSRSVGALP